MVNNKEIDLRLDGGYDLTYQTARTLDVTFTATTCNNEVRVYFNEPVPTGETPFEFSGYTGATLDVKVKPYFHYNELTFSTDDGSLSLEPNGVFKLFKTAEEMTTAYGNFTYDMFLTSNVDKVPFLRGKFILKDD